jgi:dienelactone hydrolase
MKPMRIQAFAIALLLLSAGAARADATSERLIDLALPDHVYQLGNDVYQRVLLVTPATPRGTIILLPGASGRVDLARDGSYLHDKNFVVRARDLWARRGYAVLIPDSPEDRSLRGSRDLLQYGVVIESLIALARQENPGPVFLFGMGEGSAAAVNGAAHVPPGMLAGVIVNEPPLATCCDAKFGAKDVRVPALVVANLADRCGFAPSDTAKDIAADMRDSPDVKVAIVSGGIRQSISECGPYTPHGYFGMEDQVVDLVSDWMDRHTP